MNADLFDKIQILNEFALTRFSKVLEEGKSLFDFIDEKMELFPLGIQPLYKLEGYLFLRQANAPIVKVYEYAHSSLNSQADKLSMLGTEYITDYSGTFINYHVLKPDLVKNRLKLPNPAVFAVECEYEFPMEASTLPVAKRKLIRKLKK